MGSQSQSYAAFSSSPLCLEAAVVLIRAVSQMDQGPDWDKFLFFYITSCSTLFRGKKEDCAGLPLQKQLEFRPT